VRADIPGASQLREAVGYELEFQYALWYGDWESALSAARAVLGYLTEPSFRGYRALWRYLAGIAAWRAGLAGASGLYGVAKEYFREAHKAAPSISWLRDLAREKGATE
jgi:hypothetical protein